MRERVQSFGRPPEPEMEPEMDAGLQSVPFPVIHLPVVPVVAADALEAVAAQIQARIADAVRNGFADGFNDAAAFLESEDEAAGDVEAAGR